MTIIACALCRCVDTRKENGFSTIAPGDGVIDIKGVCDVLKDADIVASTLEIIGDEDILRRSVSYLRECGV